MILINRRKAIFKIFSLGTTAATLGCVNLKMAQNLMSDQQDNQNILDIEKDSVAKAVEYVPELNRDHPQFGLQNCANCGYYVESTQKKFFGHCKLFSEGLVSEKGWCKVWKISKVKS